MNLRLPSVVLALAVGGFVAWASCIPIPIPIPGPPVPLPNSVEATFCDGGTAIINVVNTSGCSVSVQLAGTGTQVLPPQDSVTYAATYNGKYELTATSSTCTVDPGSCDISVDCGDEVQVTASGTSSSVSLSCP